MRITTNAPSALSGPPVPLGLPPDMPDGDLECDPEDWPAWTDNYFWTPTEPPPVSGGAPVQVASFTVALEGPRWLVRRDGVVVYESADEARARAALLRLAARDWVSPSLSDPEPSGS